MDQVVEKPSLHHIMEKIASYLDRKSCARFILTSKLVMKSAVPIQKYLTDCQTHKLIPKFHEMSSEGRIEFSEFWSHTSKWRLSFALWKTLQLKRKFIPYFNNGILHLDQILDLMVCMRNLEMVRLILEFKQCAPYRVLDFSIVNNHVDILKATLPFKSDSTSTQDLICRAIVYWQIEPLKVLISSTNDPNRKNSKGITPILFAVYRSNVKALKLLVPFCHTLDLNCKYRKTILHVAVEYGVDYGVREIVKILLQNFMVPKVKNSKGLSAFEMALNKRNYCERNIEIVKVFLYNQRQ